MPLSVAYALLAFAMVLIVFFLAKRARGLWFAVAACGLALAGMAALFVGMVMFITSGM